MLHVYIKRILHTHMKTSFFELNPQKEFNERTHTSAQKKKIKCRLHPPPHLLQNLLLA